ncbi:shikimate dehydrogenase [Ideonella livida]|uniref:Shikimate dehydrogenase (NADP(+)) n=1 Tax=Ideonella livida TaxID=2707176 RepID=A0A7C9PJ73_9BURK|nr:shikimate dehydrogenase [Ideonella livida]NDY93276.1 shikimate dehydrogenase [Ideonella livida]
MTSSPGTALPAAPDTVSPDRYAVVGHPVAHSRSPDIHAAFAAASGQSLTYGRLLAPLDGFVATVQDFAAQGGRGCNVTVPFKFEAFHLATRRTPRAGRAGAANTLRFDAEGWLADNTDGAGLRRDIEVNAGRLLQGLRVLLIGAGGAAAGVLGPLLEAAPAELVLVNRTLDKAERLVASHADLAHDHGVQLQARPLAQAGEGFDVVINGTATSLSGQGAPVDARVLRPGSLAVDMMYGPAAAPFLAWATARGAQGRDGLGMLVEQAAESFALWRGVRPQTGPVLARLRQQVDHTA